MTPSVEGHVAVSRARLPALDGLRGLAIATVLVHNLSACDATGTLGAKTWTAIVDAGWVGVQLFFVLSGFLITGILLDDRGHPGALRSFFVRRSLRIFPLYYAFLVGRFLVLPLLVPALEVPFGSQIWFWVYLSNWSELVLVPVYGLGHFWSLAVEEQFYLLWPWLVAKASTRAFAWTCVATVVTALGARVGMRVLGAPSAWMYASTIARADGLALGALVAVAVRSEAWTPALVRALRPTTVLASLGLAAVIAYAHGLSRINWLVQTLGYSLLAVLFGVIVASVALRSATPPAWMRWLSHPALRMLGRYSYATYVLHMPLKVAALHYVAPRLETTSIGHPVATDLAFVAVMSLGSLALAWISYRLIEQPTLSLKDRWAPRLREGRWPLAGEVETRP